MKISFVRIYLYNKYPKSRIFFLLDKINFYNELNPPKNTVLFLHADGYKDDEVKNNNQNLMP